MYVPPISAFLLDPFMAQATNLAYTITGNQLRLNWPSNYIGWLLQSNSVGLASTQNWFIVPDSGATNRVEIVIDPARPSILYRMVSPPE